MIRVIAKGSGAGHELTDRISGLRFSNVDPGGDESCSFTYHVPWRASVPELDRGNLLRVCAGLDVLWQGRIEETDRGGEDSETIDVTAYGLGARLKDSQFREVYVDRDLSHWETMSVQRRLNLVASFGPTDHSVDVDDTTGEPALRTAVADAWAASAVADSEAYYDMGEGLVLGSLYFAWKKNANVDAANVNWIWRAFVSDDDVVSDFDVTANLRAAGPSTGTLEATTFSRRFALVQLVWNAASAAGTAGTEYAIDWTTLAVYGAHGLGKQGDEDATNAKGFTASQMIANVAERAPGIAPRRSDATGFVVQQAEFREPTSHEEAIEELNRFESHQRTWGTWSPDSPLDASADGYFDYVARDTSAQHWFARRTELDDLDLHSEMSTLYNEVDVHFSDPAGGAQIVTRTRSVPELEAAGITRKARLDGSTLTRAAAETLGDTFLALSGSFAPARGSVSISRPIRHRHRGLLPPYYLRADGSNIRIPDVLPSESLFSLGDDPDRRTTFPIKRVEVDAGGETPRVSVEVDQANDVLSALQARLEFASQLVGA